MKNLSIELATEKAIQMVIMDAIENGKINKPEDAIAYMQSTTFENAVKNYVTMFQPAL